MCVYARAHLYIYIYILYICFNYNNIILKFKDFLRIKTKKLFNMLNKITYNFYIKSYKKFIN